MSKEIYLNDSQAKLIEGVNLLADAVKSTLGPSGKSVIIKNNGQEPYSTKDGVTVAMEIESDDEVMNVGIQMVKKVASKTDADGGDGTTSATVLCRELIVSGMKLKNNDDFNDHAFKTSIYSSLGKTLKKLEESSREISVEEVYNVALTSSNSDTQIATLMREAFLSTGRDGYINIIESTSGKSYISSIKGFVVNLGYVSRNFANNNVTNFFEAAEANILIFDGDLSNTKVANKIIRKSLTDKYNLKPLVVIAKDFNKQVIEMFEFNNKNSNCPGFCLVRNSLRNDEYVSLNNDIANYTGSTIITDFDEYEEVFGVAKDLVVKEGFSIFGQPEDTQKEILDSYLKELSEASDVEASPYHALSMKKRVNTMINGITTYYVGGDSDIEIKEKRDRIEDAYKACKAALSGKVVIGGGQALALISKGHFFESNSQNKDKKYEDMFFKFILAPFVNILANSLHKPEEIDFIFNNLTERNGYNAKTRRNEDLFKSGVIDPLSIVSNGLKNAVSIALTVLSTECLIVEKNPNRNEI